MLTRGAEAAIAALRKIMRAGSGAIDRVIKAAAVFTRSAASYRLVSVGFTRWTAAPRHVLCSLSGTTHSRFPSGPEKYPSVATQLSRPSTAPSYAISGT